MPFIWVAAHLPARPRLLAAGTPRMHGPTVSRRVLVVEDGPAPLALAPAFRPDFVLLDLGLPRPDGFEVARRLLADRPIEPPILVAATGHDGPAIRDRARHAGIRRLLRKPYDPIQLRAMLADPAAVPHGPPGSLGPGLRPG